MATGKVSRLVIGALAALAVAGAGPALAQHGGGGGGGGFHGGGGGAAFHGGGGGGFRGGGARSFHSAGGFRGGPYGGGHGRGGYGRGGYGGYGGYNWGGYYGGAGWLGYGLFFSALPFAYATYYWDGVPYYYADDNYYQWDSTANEYETVDPPAAVVNEAATAAPADAAPANAAQQDLFAYPKNGQSATQQAKDRTDCQQWASGQVGSDATRHPDYLRAEAACLTGRGYSVR